MKRQQDITVFRSHNLILASLRLSLPIPPYLLRSSTSSFLSFSPFRPIDEWDALLTLSFGTRACPMKRGVANELFFQVTIFGLSGSKIEGKSLFFCPRERAYENNNNSRTPSIQVLRFHTGVKRYRASIESSNTNYDSGFFRTLFTCPFFQLRNVQKYIVLDRIKDLFADTLFDSTWARNGECKQIWWTNRKKKIFLSCSRNELGSPEFFELPRRRSIETPSSELLDDPPRLLILPPFPRRDINKTRRNIAVDSGMVFHRSYTSDTKTDFYSFTFSSL